MDEPSTCLSSTAAAQAGASPRRAWRHAWGLLALAAVLFSPWAFALDEVVLANGRRYLGTIVADSPQSLVLSIHGGTVEFPRSAVVSPPWLGPPEPAPAPAAATPSGAAAPPAPHPLPAVLFALRRLHGFPWGRDIRQVPVLVADRGRWHSMPCVSFWVGGFFQASFHGDPARPAAIELSIPRPEAHAWDQKRQVLEFMFDIAPSLVVDSRFDRMNIDGDSFAVGDLWFSVASTGRGGTSGRWTVLLLHDSSVNPSRAGSAELQAISEPVSEAAIDASRPRSWQRGTWTAAELAWLRDTNAPPPAADDAAAAPVERPAGSLVEERVFVRRFARDQGRYAIASADWIEEAGRPAP
jgi:hypothetical protein